MSFENPYEAPQAESGNFEGVLKPLGSLAQSARSNELQTARWILVVLGVLGVVVSGFFVAGAEGLADEQIRMQQQHQPGLQFAPADRAEWIRTVQITNTVTGVVGVIYIIFGLVLRSAPTPIAIASLTLYLADLGFVGWVNPLALLQGIIFEVIVIAVLIKAVMAALAFSKERERGLA